MKKHKHLITGFVAMITMLVIAFTFISPSAVHAADAPFTFNLDYAYGGQLQTGLYSPFDLTITNNGSDFEGSVMLLVSGEDNQIIAHEQLLSIGAGVTKTVHFTAACYAVNPSVGIKIINKKGKTVYHTEMKININSGMSSTANVGVLTDDFSALTYLSGKTLNGITGASLNLSRLSADTLPEDSKALEMLDAIIVTNFSTDSLTEAQRLSLLNWTQRGGLLLVGTGDSAAKTLSGFDGLLNIPTNGLTKVNTSFGINNIDFTYNYNEYDYRRNFYYDYPQVRLLYEEIDFGQYFETYEADVAQAYSKDEVISKYAFELYEDYKDEIIANCWEMYFGKPYSSYSSIDSDYLANLLKDFEYYAKDDILPSILEHYIEDEYKPEQPDFYYPVNADVCRLDFGTPVVLCDSSDEVLPFASSQAYGNGNICVLAVDITKAPFVSYPGNYRLIIHLIESLAGSDILERLNNYGYVEADYNLASLLENVSSQKLIPLLIFIIIIFAYVIVAFVLFFKMRKTGKSILIWPVQAGLAVCVSVLMFLIALSTTSGGAVVSTARIITDVNGSVSEKTSSNILLPKAKHYEIPFSSDYNISHADTEYGYFYGTNQILDKGNYTICYSSDADSTTIKYNALSAMTQYNLDLEKKISVSSGIDFDCTYENGKLKGHVTNNTGKTISNALICVDFAFFKTGELVPGETIDLGNLTGVSLVANVNSSEITLKPVFDEVFDLKTNPVSVLFGTGSKAVKAEANRRALFSYLTYTHLVPVPGFGPRNYRTSLVHGKYVTEEYLIVSSELQSSGDSSLGIDENGFIRESHANPILLAFTENGESVLDKPSRSENVAEIIIVTAGLPENDYSIQNSHYSFYGDVYYNGRTVSRNSY